MTQTSKTIGAAVPDPAENHNPGPVGTPASTLHVVEPPPGPPELKVVPLEQTVKVELKVLSSPTASPVKLTEDLPPANFVDDFEAYLIREGSRKDDSIQGIVLGLARVRRGEIRGSLKSAAAAAGLPNWYHHAFRKLTTIRMIEANVPVPVILAILGHRDNGATILNNYRHYCQAAL